MSINSTNNALTKPEVGSFANVSAKDKKLVDQAQSAPKLSQLNLEKDEAKAQEVNASEAQVKDAVAKIKEYVQQTERTLDFRVDEDSGQTVVSVFDKSSQKLIRQIPDELALELAQRLNDEEPFNIFRAQV